MEKGFGDQIEQDDVKIDITSDGSGSTSETEEVDNLVDLIEKKRAEVHPSLSSEFLICRVPQKIWEINPKAYEPRVVSIGPFHHGDVRYKSMEEFKMRFLNKVVQRNTEVPLKNYIKYLKAHETTIRQCYSETIEMDTDGFLTMLLLDSCFIIEIMLCDWFEAYGDADFYILGSARLWGDVKLDLISLENQIPFFVLEGLYSLAMTGLQPIPLLSLAINFFSKSNPQNKAHDDITSIKHFTDLILIFNRPTPPSTTAGVFLGTKSITELDEAGIKLKRSTSKCLLDIKFNDGILEIPCIKFQDNTECKFRNMMALENCNYYHNSYMIDYFIFLDYLINTPKDVDLLVQSGILENWLGDSKQIADIINNMNINMNINAEKYKFSCLSRELNAYCKIPKHKWRAALKREYFSTPWRGASTSAAIFLLVLTLIQTILSILSAARGQ